jgi:Cu/Ag efflux protein CusF
MKHVFIVFAAAILVFCVAWSANAQNVTGLNPSSNSSSKRGTGVIAKIDPQSRTITVRDFSVNSNASEPTGNPNESADQTNTDSAKSTQVFKYSQQTNFASITPEQMNGRMSDLQVGDSVSLEFDSQNNLVRIEEISSPPQQ